jgi:hypothetical protein
MKWIAVASLALALAACDSQREESPKSEAPAPEPAAEAQPTLPDAPEVAPLDTAAPDAPSADQTPPPAPQKDDKWRLSEFDWGDSPDTVAETIHFTDGFLCYTHKLFERCAFVKTKIDGEELLAQFSFVDGKLWRIDVQTPDLDASQADEHLERVWKLLAAWVTRFKGEAPEQQPFPQRDALAPKQEVVTHRWRLPDQEIRIVVGGAPEDGKWFTSARAVDPAWSKQDPPAQRVVPLSVPKKGAHL